MTRDFLASGVRPLLATKVSLFPLPTRLRTSVVPWPHRKVPCHRLNSTNNESTISEGPITPASRATDLYQRAVAHGFIVSTFHSTVSRSSWRPANKLVIVPLTIYIIVADERDPPPTYTSLSFFRVPLLHRHRDTARPASCTCSAPSVKDYSSSFCDSQLSLGKFKRTGTPRDDKGSVT